jgi:hypothetical protein
VSSDGRSLRDSFVLLVRVDAQPTSKSLDKLQNRTPRMGVGSQSIVTRVVYISGS